MEAQRENLRNPTRNTDCWRSKISYNVTEDLIYIEHFGKEGELLSKVVMDWEDAYDYSKMVEDVADFAVGVFDDD